MTQTAQTREALVEVMAAAIANARGGRRGMLTVTNIMDLLPDKLRIEVREDARACIAALEAAGVRLVPVELTEDMGAEMECQFSTDGQWEAALAASPYKAKEPTND